jgi:hypothetical protein
MAIKWFDLVADTASTTGTGTFTVSGTAPSGYRTFSTVLSVADEFVGRIKHQTANEWEVGIGTYTATNEVTRSIVLASSNSDAVVSFSAGTKDIFIIAPARLEFGASVERTASHTLVASDIFQLVEMNVGSANNLTVPLNSTTAFPIGTRIDILQTGAGQTTVVATGGVTINSKGGNLKITGQWSAATLIKRATNTWVLFGDLTA